MDNSSSYTPLPPIKNVEIIDSQQILKEANNTAGNNSKNNIYKKYGKKSDDEILAKVHITLSDLSDLQDMNKKEASGLCTVLHTLCKIMRKKDKLNKVAEKLVEIDLCVVYRKILKNHFEEMMRTNNKNLLATLPSLVYIVYISSDVSSEFCLKFTEEGLNEIYMSFLNGEHFVDHVILNDKKMMKICDNLLSAVYNVVHVNKIQAARDRLRKENAVNICQKYRKSSSLMISFIALVIQAYLINEAENEELNSEISIFEFVLRILEASLLNKAFEGSTFSPEESIDAVNVLAVSDANKYKLIEAGVLKYYVDILQNKYQVSDGVIAMSAQGIWMLCFKCADQVKAYPGIIGALKEVAGHNSAEIREKAEGALWYLEDKEKAEKSVESKKKKVPTATLR